MMVDFRNTAADGEVAQAIEITNEHGFLQVVDETGSPICSSCGAAVMTNRGQGTICHACEHDFMLHCEHDL